MVSRKLVALLPAVFFACGSAETSFGSHVVGSSVPVLISASPATAAIGEAVTVTGSGFSIVAPENVVSTGSASISALSYDIAGDGSETLTFEVPANAIAGENPLFVIVGGQASNSLTLTVTP